MNTANNQPLINQLPTSKQLERTISQKFAALYRHKLGYFLRQVQCKIFDNYIVIVADNAITPLELMIRNSGQIETLLEMRRSIDPVLKSQLSLAIEEIISVKVEDALCELNFETNRMMAIAILAETPKVRSSKKLYKSV